MFLLGTITYNIAKDWDVDTILKRLEALKYPGVELRTGHKHGVEVALTPVQRREVRKKFDDSPVDLAGLGSAFEYHSSDPAEVRRNIDETKAYVRLAHDIGSPGVKVRPNGVPKGENPDIAFQRIGKALHEIGKDAQDYGIEIRVEVHGAVTSDVPNLAKIIEYADHPNVYVCWNSNSGEAKNGSILDNFKLLSKKIREVHLRDLTDDSYPWIELFGLLKGIDYHGYTLAEIPESTDPDRVLRYFRSLWLAYTSAAKSTAS